MNLSLIRTHQFTGYSLKDFKMFVEKLGKLSALNNWLSGKDLIYINEKAIISAKDVTEFMESEGILRATLTTPLQESNIDV